MHARRLLLLTILVTLGALLLAPAVQAVGWVNTHSWGTYGTQPGQLAEAAGMAVSDGLLYVGDYSNNRVEVFTLDGAYLRSWSVNSPAGVAVDRSTGKVYVGSSTGVASVWTIGGASLGALTTGGSGDGQTQGAYGIAVDPDGDVYVVDLGNRRVQVFDSSGAYLRQFGGSGSGDGQFLYPAGIDLDSDGNIYVFDLTLQRVSKFSNAGTFLTKWGVSGSGQGQFTNAMCLTVDANDHVFVGDRGNDRIQEFTADGAWVRSITAEGLTAPLGLTAGPQETLFASRNFSGTKIFRFDWDDTAPTVDHDYDGEWHSQPFTVHFSAKDDFTAVPWLRWTTNMVDWTNDGAVVVPAPATHSYDGFRSFTIGAGDSVSNWAYKTLPVKIDTRAPASRASGVPGGWTNQEVWVSIDATDVGSGVNRTFYDLDGNGTTELADNGLVIIDTAGAHTLQYFSQDNCADTPNQESAKSVQVLIDMMGPTAIPTNSVTVKRGGKATFKYTLNDDWSPTCTVKLVIQKKGKTVKTVSLGTRNSSLQVPPHAYSKSMAVSLTAGTYTWTVTARDLAGNTGSWAPKKLIVK
jgi:hypothetical protein